MENEKHNGVEEKKEADKEREGLIEKERSGFTYFFFSLSKTPLNRGFVAFFFLIFFLLIIRGLVLQRNFFF